MNFNKLAYPDTFTIADIEHKGKRDMSKGELRIPYTDEPNVSIGDVIYQKSGKQEISLKIIDLSFLEGGSLNVGTRHPNMLTLKVQNTTSQPHIQQSGSSIFNIASVSGSNVQVGNSNAK